MNTPTLETDRLILRRFSEEDINALFLILKNEEVNTFLPWYPVKSIDETRKFWHQGIVSEAGKAVVSQVKRDGLPYITATHDRNNPRSGNVMRNVGMKYQYSFEEQWQPKNIVVIFRMYQLNLDGQEDRIYKKYWDTSAVHFVEPNL